MYYYLSKYGVPGMPAGGEDIPSWTSIHFTPAPWVIWASPRRYDGLRRVYLGDDAQRPSPSAHRQLSRALGMNLGPRGLGRMLLEALLCGTRWKRLQPAKDLYEVWLGNEVVASMRSISGGLQDCSTPGPLSRTLAASDFSLGPVPAPYTGFARFGNNLRPIEVIQDAIDGLQYFKCVGATTIGFPAMFDTRGYACDHSARGTAAQPASETVQVLAAGHGALTRIRLQSEIAHENSGARADGAYHSFVDDPTAGTFEYRLSRCTESTSSAGPPPDATYTACVLAREVLGSDRLVGDITSKATGSSINGTATLAVFGQLDTTVTDTVFDSGHPGIYGNIRAGTASTVAHFSSFSFTGGLDGGEETFLDP